MFEWPKNVLLARINQKTIPIMKNTLSIVAFGGILALASCASGPTPEELAAQEQARLDSIAAVEQFRADSIAQALAEAEAAAYAAGQAAATKTTTTKTTTTTTKTEPAVAKPASTGNPITDKKNAAEAGGNPIDAKKQKAEEGKDGTSNPILDKKKKATGN